MDDEDIQDAKRELSARRMGGGDQGAIGWRPGHTMARSRKVRGGADEQVVDGGETTLVGRMPVNTMKIAPPLKPQADITNWIGQNLPKLQWIDLDQLVIAYPAPGGGGGGTTTTTTPEETTTTTTPEETTTTTTPEETTTTTTPEETTTTTTPEETTTTTTPEETTTTTTPEETTTTTTPEETTTTTTIP